MRRVPPATLAAMGVVLAAAASPARARAQDLVCGAGDPVIRELVFRGNRAFASDDLADRILTTESSWMVRTFGRMGTRRCLNKDEFPYDVLRLRKFYRERGYYTAKVDTAVQPLAGGFVRVTFQITEGEPIRVDSLTIAGLDSVRNRAAILGGLGLKVGQPFDLSVLRADIDSILLRLRNSGYPKADRLLDYTVVPESLRARVALTVLPGPRTRIGEIRVHAVPLEGGDKPQIGDGVVRSVLGIRRGDLYSDDRMVSAQRNLYQLGTYRHVEVSPDSVLTGDPGQPLGDSVVALQVELREDNMKQFDTQVGWATLDCFRTRTAYTDKNFLGRARRLELVGSMSKLGYGAPLATQTTKQLCYQKDLKDDPIFSDTTNYSIVATLHQPGLSGGGWVRTYSLYRERRSEFQAYLRSTLFGGRASATKDLSANSTLLAAYNLEYGYTIAQPALLCAVFSRCKQEERDQILRPARLGIASAQYNLVRTDDAFNPSRGFVLRSELKSSLRVFLSSSDQTFNKGTIDALWYLPVGRSGVFATRIRAGALLSEGLSLINASQFIPPSERLYAGGANSVRGFQQNQLGSLLYLAQRYDTVKVTDSLWYFRTRNDTIPFRVVPVGGNALFVANFEYRVPDIFFPRTVQYAFFVDGGDLWTRGTPGTGLGLAKMSWTPGIGVRVSTPVGPFQVNVAYNPYPQPLGAIYYDAPSPCSISPTTCSSDPAGHVAPLFCVSPNNTIPVHVHSDKSVAQDEVGCPQAFTPLQSANFFKRLTFTFALGAGF